MISLKWRLFLESWGCLSQCGKNLIERKFIHNEVNQIMQYSVRNIATSNYDAIRHQYNGILSDANFYRVYPHQSKKYEHTLPDDILPYDRTIPRTVEEVKETLDAEIISPPNSKLLKVAIIGVPNSGKSTLINKLVRWKVCCVSKKVHTTVCNARAILNEGSTQVIFLDTPGVITPEEAKKYKLKRPLLIDPELSVEQADIIAVLHDISIRFTQRKLHQQILRLLALHPTKPCILILNKADLVQNKEKMLGIITSVTCKRIGGVKMKFSVVNSLSQDEILQKALGSMKNVPVSEQLKHPIIEFTSDSAIKSERKLPLLDGMKCNGVDKLKTEEIGSFEVIEEENCVKPELGDISHIDEIDVFEGRVQLTEAQAKTFVQNRHGWGNFEQIFVISALEGFKTDELRDCFLQKAKPNSWIFGSEMVTDQAPQEIAIMTVREKCLEYFHNDVPYKMKFQLGYWNLSESDVLSLIVNVYCGRKDHVAIGIGKDGSRVKMIAQAAEQELRNAFRSEVRLKLSFQYDASLKKKPLASIS